MLDCVSKVDLDIGDFHMENNKGFTKEDFEKFFAWRGEYSDWWGSWRQEDMEHSLWFWAVIQN